MVVIAVDGAGLGILLVGGLLLCGRICGRRGAGRGTPSRPLARLLRPGGVLGWQPRRRRGGTVRFALGHARSICIIDSQWWWAPRVRRRRRWRVGGWRHMQPSRILVKTHCGPSTWVVRGTRRQDSELVFLWLTNFEAQAPPRRSYVGVQGTSARRLGGRTKRDSELCAGFVGFWQRRAGAGAAQRSLAVCRRSLNYLNSTLRSASTAVPSCRERESI